MADYDWDDGVCGACKHQYSHSPDCSIARKEEEKAAIEARGFKWSKPAQAYRCMRGCGSLVWDIDAHEDHVCRIYSHG